MLSFSISVYNAFGKFWHGGIVFSGFIEQSILFRIYPPVLNDSILAIEFVKHMFRCTETISVENPVMVGLPEKDIGDDFV